MSAHYNASEVESKWQRYWKDHNTYHTPNESEGRENYFVLSEFSYPSGNLHVGHWYAFALPDIFARFKRMQGYNVLYPTGFDAFGLPAENAAIKRGEDPMKWTWEHMDNMRTQLRTMGTSFDWSREIITADPNYYRWTQWFFTTFYKNNLVYRDTTKVNWCENDKTILANEQVHNGSCERCGGEVLQKDMSQWMLRISDFADELVDDLEDLPWNHAIKQAQREWIGRKEGSTIPFNISGQTVEVFTTRADTLYGVSYLVLAPEHDILQKLEKQIENLDEVQNYIQEVKKKSERDRQQSGEKTGVELKGVHALHPLTNEELPLWVADYVLPHVGTGAVMAVPAHDVRDAEFAEKYNLEVRQVVVSETEINSEEVYTGEGTLINSGLYSELSSEEARTKITTDLGGTITTTYRLRDWGISRQRYWGCPIPIVYDPEGKPHPVPEEHLPWVLPTDVDHTPDGTPPLARSKELKQRTEEIFGKGWTPEVDTMDTFVDSSWYFYRYLDPHNEDSFASQELRSQWMPVNTYFGGAEHTTMHLLYSRFWTKALHRLGLVDEEEPYAQRFNRGLILGPDGAKMSKSKGNVIDPDDVVAHVGADTVRTYLAFIGPFDEPGNYPWDPNGVVGVRRFLDKVYRLRTKVDTKAPLSEELLHEQHTMLKKVGEDIERLKYNTAISAMMVFVGIAEKEEAITPDTYITLLKALAPFAPHLVEELWSLQGEESSIHLSPWPLYDESYLVSDTVNIAVQINGKVRGNITIAPGIEEEEVKEQVLNDPNLTKWFEGTHIKKVIYVPEKIINFVV